MGFLPPAPSARPHHCEQPRPASAWHDDTRWQCDSCGTVYRVEPVMDRNVLERQWVPEPAPSNSGEAPAAREAIAGIISDAADKYRGLAKMGTPTTQDYEAADALIAAGYTKAETLQAVETARRELFAMSTDKTVSLDARAAYRDASRAINTALAGHNSGGQP